MLIISYLETPDMKFTNKYCYAQKMNPIPTRPVWDLLGRDPEDDVRFFERFDTMEEAEARLAEAENEKPELSYTVHESRSIIPDRTMPTESQQRELMDLMHHGFVALRNLGYAKKHEAIAELADTFHNLPHEMFQEDVWDWNLLECGLREFEEKFPDDKIYPFAGMLRRIRNGHNKTLDTNT